MKGFWIENAKVVAQIQEVPNVEMPTMARMAFWGESLFTSFRSYKGQFLFLNDHWQRLQQGAQFLFPRQYAAWVEQIGGGGDLASWWERSLTALNAAQKDGELKDLYFRVMFSCLGSSFKMHDPHKKLNVLIFAHDEVAAIHSAQDPFGLSALAPVTMKFSRYPRDFEYWPSFIKPNNFLLEMRELDDLSIAGQMATQLQDLLYLNSTGEVVDAISSNVFYCQGENLMVPPIGRGVVEGILRKNFLLFLHLSRHKERLRERAVRQEEVREMDQLFLSNCVRGFVPVRAIREEKGEYFFPGCSWLRPLLQEFSEYACNKMLVGNK